jgi:meiotically up-regulated gene 157 (Mug157) protein
MRRKGANMKVEVPEILIKRAEELEIYYKEKMPAIAPLIKQCFLNTIETTVKQLEDESYFVITGDIPAMWLRDSAAQVRPYVKYSKDDEYLGHIMEGIIAKQVELVLIDPYANAFNSSPNGKGHQDDTQLNDSVWERKYEIDSLCAPIYLIYTYWKETAKETLFTSQLKEMIQTIIKIFRIEQNHDASDYSFQRKHCVESDTLSNDGKGAPINRTGMTWSGFRPSDDRCIYGYLIPSNMMAVRALAYAEEMCKKEYKDANLAKECSELAREIEEGIKNFGVIEHPDYGKIYSYETDGKQNYVLMDDANSPSLLSMPYIEYCDKTDELYQNTRKFILSKDNPYYVEGTYAKGVGSPHTPEGYVWHIGIIMQALTSQDREEVLECLDIISKTHAGTNYMHESFDPDNPDKYTRTWFAWANTLFAELLDNLCTKQFF